MASKSIRISQYVVDQLATITPKEYGKVSFNTKLIILCEEIKELRLLKQKPKL